MRSRTSFSRVFSGMITFCPCAWHAAQLPLKTPSPTAASPAKAGDAKIVSAAAALAAATFVSLSLLLIGELKARAATVAAANIEIDVAMLWR